ncbi:hypothetical protein B296_00048619 [Ensete ventricosum]|uniref:Uncharacterized protein n=1 Tax=Ensete ventricosum TaxID=4639 RepID=A0A426XNR0_ENSVE|nr:hypothetical protein B296_00048619 [Ensete ventricosum]
MPRQHLGLSEAYAKGGIRGTPVDSTRDADKKKREGVKLKGTHSTVALRVDGVFAVIVSKVPFDPWRLQAGDSLPRSLPRQVDAEGRRLSSSASFSLLFARPQSRTRLITGSRTGPHVRVPVTSPNGFVSKGDEKAVLICRYLC